MSALEKSMRDATANLGLVHLSIDFNRFPDEPEHTWFNVSGQWLVGSAEYGRGMAFGTGPTIEDAIADMLRSLAAKRGGAIIDTSEALEVAA